MRTVTDRLGVRHPLAYQAFGNAPLAGRLDDPSWGNKYLRFVSFNIMAASWSEPKTYLPIPPKIVNRDYRFAKIVKYFRMARQADIDVYVLQEVNEREFKKLREAFRKDFYSQMAYNAPGYWATERYLPDPAKWEPNGTAILARRSSFPKGNEPEFSQHALDDAGNFCLAMKISLIGTNTTLRVFGVHLDDTPKQPDDDQLTMMGRKETEALMRLVGDPRDGVVDVIAGDLNINLGPQSPLTEIFHKHEFVDVINILNVQNVPVATSPYHMSPNEVTEADTYDHILVRNAKPLHALVRHYGAEAVADNSRRAEKFMKAAGSDHYPVEATIKINV